MTYDPKQNYYRTNPISAICEYFAIDWAEIWTLGRAVGYGETISRTVEDRMGRNVHIAIYRMPSGNYEAVTYRC